MKGRQYQALLAGAAIATVLLFLVAQLVRSHSRNGLAIFDGNLPPIPEYAADDKPVLRQPDRRDSYLTPQTTSMSKPAGITPLDTPVKQWDDAWDDKDLWPKISKSPPTPASVSTGWTLPTNHISHATIAKYVRSILDFENDSSPGFRRTYTNQPVSSHD